jgi:hypothetical protein
MLLSDIVVIQIQLRRIHTALDKIANIAQRIPILRYQQSTTKTMVQNTSHTSINKAIEKSKDIKVLEKENS